MMKNKKLAALLGLLLAGSMTVSMAAWKKPDRFEIIAMTLLFALTLVLTVLKVTRTVSLPWLWVLGPLWLGTYRYRD